MTDDDARRELARADRAYPDRYWADRWGWTVQQVARLRLGGARDAKLPPMYARHLERLR